MVIKVIPDSFEETKWLSGLKSPTEDYEEEGRAERRRRKGKKQTDEKELRSHLS